MNHSSTPQTPRDDEPIYWTPFHAIGPCPLDLRNAIELFDVRTNSLAEFTTKYNLSVPFSTLTSWDVMHSMDHDLYAVVSPIDNTYGAPPHYRLHGVFGYHTLWTRERIISTANQLHAIRLFGLLERVATDTTMAQRFGLSALRNPMSRFVGSTNTLTL